MNAQLSTLNFQIKKPAKLVVPISVGTGWRDDGYIYQEKLDGEFETLEFEGGNILAGESMPPLPDGRDRHFVAFDCLQFDGRDVRAVPLIERLAARPELCRRYSVPELPAFPDGGQLLRDVLARGGEGVVRKRPDATWWDAMEAAKRMETFRCGVIGFNGGTNSVQIGLLPNGELSTLNIELSTLKPCGNVPLRGGKCDQVRAGSILKVEGFGLTADGKIREPRVCSDTTTSWLVQW